MPGGSPIRISGGSPIAIAHDLEPTRRGREHTVDASQTFGQRLVLGRPSQLRKRARTVPALRDRPPCVEPRTGDPFGVEMTAAGELAPAARMGSRGSGAGVPPVESGPEVRIGQDPQQHLLVGPSRPRREQRQRPGLGARTIRSGRCAGQDPWLHDDAIAEPRDARPGLVEPETAVAGLRQDLGEQSDVVEVLDAETGNVDSEARVDEPTGRTAAEPHLRRGGDSSGPCRLDGPVRTGISPRRLAISGFGRRSGFGSPRALPLMTGRRKRTTGRRTAGRQPDQLRALTRGTDLVETEPRQRRLPRGGLLAPAQGPGSLDEPPAGLRARRTIRPLQGNAIVLVEAPSRGRVGNHGHQDPCRVIAQTPPHQHRDIAS